MRSLATLAAAHLSLRLRALNRALSDAVARQAELAARLRRPDVTPMCVSREQVLQLLADVGKPSDLRRSECWELAEEDRRDESGLWKEAVELCVTLPLDRIRDTFRLSEPEIGALLLCVAVELDRSYERIYAYVLDDLSRRFPCIELLSVLRPARELCEVRRIVARSGALRRNGLVVATEHAQSELRTELRLGAGVFRFLIGAVDSLPEGLGDTEEVPLDTLPPLGGPLMSEIGRLADAVVSGDIDCLGLWGVPSHVAKDVLLALARHSERPLRRLDVDTSTGPADAALRSSLACAAELGAILWIELGDSAPHTDELRATLERLLPRSSAIVVLSATHPWRSLGIIEARRYMELTPPVPGDSDRRAQWSGIASLDPRAAEVIAQFRMDAAEVRAALKLADQRAHLAGASAADEDHLRWACGVTTRRTTTAYATLTEPRRKPQDLVLPATLHAEVLQIGAFYRAWERVGPEWGLARLNGGAGLKALFSGDSGTGKTLAAEVIASLIGAPLMKVDLANIVSKWVGETEKQIDHAFREAAEQRAVLFFDEADALFGKRGAVDRGTDRYANLEVSYLLQKLEDPSFQGLALFATNLKENVDVAFLRRFNFILHFPRPAEAERARIWRLALPSAVPVAADVDMGAFSHLDMTGAGIVAAARTGALIAASNGDVSVTNAHLLAGIQRQFRQEARILLESDLRPAPRRIVARR